MPTAPRGKIPRPMREGSHLTIAGEIHVWIYRVRGRAVQLQIDAPRSVPISEVIHACPSSPPRPQRPPRPKRPRRPPPPPPADPCAQ